MLRKTITLALMAGAFVLSACNTVAGAGEDLKSASKEVEKEIK